MDQTYKWKKKPMSGSHTFSFLGKRFVVKPGMVVEASERALGGAIRKYDCLGPVGEAIDITEMGRKPEFIPVVKQLILMPHGKSRSRFNIVNPDNLGKPLNDKPLLLAAAEKILGEMNKGLE